MDYLELHGQTGEGEFRKRVEVAAVKVAQKVMDNVDNVAPFNQAAGKHDLRLKLAIAHIKSPTELSDNLQYYILAKNDQITLAQLGNVTDEQILDQVEAVWDSFSTQFEAVI